VRRAKAPVFTVVLPYQISNEAETTGVRLSPVSVAGPLLNKIKILVAEDNLMNQKLLKHLLAQWQINFDIVNNGAEAVKVLEQRTRRLCVGIDGYTNAGNGWLCGD
jgi:PleD family two-component response regulator